MRAGRLRRGRLIAGIAGVCFAVFVAATAAMFVWPAADRPGRADAIVVLGGDGPRDAMGDALVRDGVATTLAVSVGSPYDPCFHRRTAFTLICFVPNPRTTQGEARWIAANAKALGWHRVVVVGVGPAGHAGAHPHPALLRRPAAARRRRCGHR